MFKLNDKTIYVKYENIEIQPYQGTSKSNFQTLVIQKIVDDLGNFKKPSFAC